VGEALWHLAREIDDVALLGSGDEHAADTELSQLGCDRAAALRIE